MRAVAVALALLSLLLAACGTGPVRSASGDRPQTDDAVTVNDRLYVAHAKGISVVSVATGKVERDLPAGVMAPDRSAYWALEPGDPTIVRRLDPASGSELGRTAVAGSFDLPRAEPYGGRRADAISGNGRYLVLAGTAEPSTFAVLDLRDGGKERARARLPGTFSFDAIDDLGSSMYLLEHPVAGSDRYNVRLYDLGLNVLAAQPVVDQKAAIPTAADLAKGTMGGIYHASGTAGTWHFGVYVSSSKGPVVHALNMSARYASCLFDLAAMSTHRTGWAIATSPTRAFVVNAASGAFASIDAQTLQAAKREFSVQRGHDGELRGSAVLSGDGTRLYATGGKGLLVVDAHTLSMRAQYLVDREFASVMVSTDGTRLYALGRDGAITRLEPGSGRDLGVVAHLPDAVSIVRID